MGCRWARKQTPKAGADSASRGSGSGGREEWQEAGYSEATQRSLAVVDESLLNYDLLEALVVHIVQLQASHGPAALLQARPCPQLCSLLVHKPLLMPTVLVSKSWTK